MAVLQVRRQGAQDGKVRQQDSWHLTQPEVPLLQDSIDPPQPPGDPSWTSAEPLENPGPGDGCGPPGNNERGRTYIQYALGHDGPVGTSFPDFPQPAIPPDRRGNTMTRQAYEKWLPAATALTHVRDSFSTPLHVTLSEAVELSSYVHAYWEPARDSAGNEVRPGLSQAGSKLHLAIADELLELGEALQTAQTNYLLTVAPVQTNLRARAEFVLSEISAALRWWLEDGTVRKQHPQLSALRSEYADGSDSVDSLATELSDYAALARQEVENLKGLGGFSPALVDEARGLANKLREQRSQHVVPHHARRALDLRRRLATLLLERVMRVRAAARFVFRNHPEIARKASSNYERRRRALSRQASARARAQNRGASLGPDTPKMRERAISIEREY